MTEDNTHTYDDLIKTAEIMFPDCYASQAGHLRAVLYSVLISVKHSDRDLYEEILDFEMRVTETQKGG